MVFLLFCILTFQCPANAKSSRTARMSDGDLEPIYVEPGFSTIIKFDSHPEPGLIGDQDGFKVEYMKNLVAIKPLVSKAKTNLFIFTKDGQFNFQLIASRGKHDNVVYAKLGSDKNNFQPSNKKVVVSLDELSTKKINKIIQSENFKLSVESIAMPRSHATLVLKFAIQDKSGLKNSKKVEPQSLSLYQGSTAIKIENVFLERKKQTSTEIVTTGFILLRSDAINKKKNLTLKFTSSEKKNELQVMFSPDLGFR